MGALLRAVLVLRLLHPACLLTQEPPDPPASDPDPSLNLRFDPRTMNLTWDCGPNATSVGCGMSTRDRGPVTMRLKGPQCHCAFPRAVLHGGATFTVTFNLGPRTVTEKLTYTNPGGQGTAAHNVSCLVRRANLLTCTWVKGPTAPDDVHYFLHVRDLRSGRWRECPRCRGDGGTPHLGCRLEGASAFGSEVYILVNGSSPQAVIQFFDETLVLKRIEIYDPPDNITVQCNASHCAVRWDTPRIRVFLSNRELQYQLGIHRQDSQQPSDHQLVELSGGWGNSYVFQKPAARARHTVRLRAADSRLLRWGPWSEPVEFGSGGGLSTELFVSLVILGSLACVLTVLYLFHRFVGVPIPKVKDKVNSDYLTDDKIIWEKFAADPGKGDQEEVSRVEEMEESTAKV